MTVTPAAEKRLHDLIAKAGADVQGLRVSGLIGTCRGSTPILKPLSGPLEAEDIVMEYGEVTLFVAADCRDLLENATLDYDPSLFGKGLTVTWPHREGCACQQRK